MRTVFRAGGARALAAVIATIVATPACDRAVGDPPQRPGTVIVPGGWDSSRVRVIAGVHWASEAQFVTRPDHEGRFTLSTSYDVARAYLDRDGDQQLDGFQEPVTDCSRRGERWTCRLAPQRSFVHRLRLVDGSTTTDALYAVAETFDRDTGAPDENASLCAAASGQCASRGSGPYFAPGSALILANCDTAETRPVLELVSAGETTSFRLRAPPPVVATAELEVLDDGRTRVVAATDTPIDRAVVTIATMSDGAIDRVLWTSASSSGALAVEGSRLEAELPRIAACGDDCSVVVQLMTTYDYDVATFSELRYIASMRGAP